MKLERSTACTALGKPLHQSPIKNKTEFSISSRFSFLREVSTMWGWNSTFLPARLGLFLGRHVSWVCLASHKWMECSGAHGRCTVQHGRGPAQGQDLLMVESGEAWSVLPSTQWPWDESRPSTLENGTLAVVWAKTNGWNEPHKINA